MEGVAPEELTPPCDLSVDRRVPPEVSEVERADEGQKPLDRFHGPIMPGPSC